MQTMIDRSRKLIREKLALMEKTMICMEIILRRELSLKSLRLSRK